MTERCRKHPFRNHLELFRMSCNHFNYDLRLKSACRLVKYVLKSGCRHPRRPSIDHPVRKIASTWIRLSEGWTVRQTHPVPLGQVLSMRPEAARHLKKLQDHHGPSISTCEIYGMVPCTGPTSCKVPEVVCEWRLTRIH